MKHLIFPLTACFTLIAQGAIANGIAPKPVPCYFFKGEDLMIKNICVYESYRWLGGMAAELAWEDGVKTGISYGIQPPKTSSRRTGKACPENKDHIKVDNICGPRYYRYFETLKRVAKADTDQLFRDANSPPVIQCIQVKNSSVCWRL
jgi:hypothetical protein